MVLFYLYFFLTRLKTINIPRIEAADAEMTKEPLVYNLGLIHNLKQNLTFFEITKRYTCAEI